MLCITKKFRFEAAHALFTYDGTCKNIHGHSYELLVSITGKKDERTGMILDFKWLKKMVEETFLHQIDHALLSIPNTLIRQNLKIMMAKYIQ